MYIILDDNGRITDTSNPINILSGKAVGPLGTPGQVLAVSPDGENLVWTAAGGGSVSGSGIANQVAYWSTPTTLAGDGGFTYNAGTDTLTVTGAVNTASVTVTTPGVSAGEYALYLINPSTAAFATVKQQFRAAATTAAYAEIQMQANNAGPGASLLFYTNDNAGALTSRGSMDYAGVLNWNGNTVISGALALGAATLRSAGFYNQVGSAVSGATWSRTFVITAGAHTALTSECFDIQIDLTPTVQYANGSIPTQTRAIYIQPRTYSAVSVGGVMPDAAMLVIQSGPINGPNMTVTRPMALWVQAGWTRLGGGLTVGTSITQPAVGALETTGTITSAGSIIANGGVAATGTMTVTGTMTATGIITSNDSFSVVYTTAGTATAASVLNFTVQSSGTPAAGFGALTNISLETSTGVFNRQASTDTTTWATATEGSQKARRVFSIWDTVTREAMRMEASGAAAMLGFFGSAAIVKGTAFTQTYATAAHTITQTTMTDPLAYVTGANGYSTTAMASAIHAEVIALRANMIVTQNVLNGLIDDLQALGLV